MIEITSMMALICWRGIARLKHGSIMLWPLCCGMYLAAALFCLSAGICLAQPSSRSTWFICIDYALRATATVLRALDWCVRSYNFSTLFTSLSNDFFAVLGIVGKVIYKIL